ncbi:MAG: hypothetical protein IJO46_14780 [Thermoguttaceae bacterium]|nr:hypothetical protein [Thermoguttaceae bacterium]
MRKFYFDATTRRFASLAVAARSSIFSPSVDEVSLLRATKSASAQEIVLDFRKIFPKIFQRGSALPRRVIDAFAATFRRR